MKVVKVLKYQNIIVEGQPRTRIEAIVKAAKAYSVTDKTGLYDWVSDSEEPTAAMFLAMTDSLIARGELDKAEQAAKTAITLSGGDQATLMTLFTILYKAGMMALAKKAVAAIDEETYISQIDEFVKDKPTVRQRIASRLSKRA